MTVEANDPFVEYTYTGPATFPFIFKIQEDDDLTVIHVDGTTGDSTILELNTDYIVDINVDTDGGSAEVTYDGTDGNLQMGRAISPDQLVDWVNNTPFDMEILEDAVDKLTMLIQQLIWKFSQEGEIPLSQKGDLMTHDGIGLAKLPVGADGMIVVASLNAALGLKYSKLKDIPLDPDDPGAGTPGTGPLTTKGDLYGFSTESARVPVDQDGKVLSGDSSDPNGVSYQKLADLPWDPDDPGNVPGGGIPEPPPDDLNYGRSTSAGGTSSWVEVGSGGGGDGIIPPDVPPASAKQLVAYASTTGNKADDPSVRVLHEGIGTDAEIQVGSMLISSDGTNVLEISAAASAGATVRILSGDGSSLEIIVPADPAPDQPMYIQSASAPLELIAPDIYVNDMKWPQVGEAVQGAYMTAITPTELGFISTSGDNPILYQSNTTPGGPI